MINYINDKRFHAHTFKIYCMLPFLKKDLPALTLLSFVLKNKARGYDNLSAVVTESERLYAFDFSISHFFDIHNLFWRIGFTIVDKRLVQNQQLYQDAMDFIYKIAFDDYEPRYDEKVLNEQKIIVINLLKELQNRPRYIASQRFNELLDDEWSLSISPYGLEEEIKKVTCQDLMDLHQRIIKAPKDLYGIGPGNENEIIDHLKEHLTFDGHITSYFFEGRKKHDIVEQEGEKAIEQTHIMMGYALDKPCSFFEARLLNALIGELGTSRLFVEVREKNSLCYSTSSSLNYYNHMIFIHSAVNQRQSAKAQTVIKEVIENLHFSKKELEEAKEMIKSSLLCSCDSAPGLLSIMIENIRHDYPSQEVQTFIDGYSHVSLRRINYLAKHITYQGAYILKGVKKYES